ncbi:MAG: hypothetical protein AAGD86_01160 [Pseudomonadota bacterium]
MKQAMRWLVGFVLAVLVAGALASVASTQFVLHELGKLGVAVSPGDRLAMTVHDVVGMLPLYGGVIAVAFLVALPVAQWLSRRAPQAAGALHFAAGFAALVVALKAMQLSFDITPVAGARSAAGLLVQGLAGGLAALVLLAQRR